MVEMLMLAIRLYDVHNRCNFSMMANNKGHCECGFQICGKGSRVHCKRPISFLLLPACMQ